MISLWVHWHLASVKPVKITQTPVTIDSSFFFIFPFQESGPCALVVALCGHHHITTSTQEGESPHRWLR